MPLDISSNAVLEKNRITSDHAWLLLLEIVYPDEQPVRVCLNNETVTWDGQTWLPAHFSLTGLSETKDAEIPNVKLVVKDILGNIIPHVENHNGGVGAAAKMRVVNSKYLSNPTPELEEQMEIVGCHIDSSRQITFDLGAENLITLRCPVNRYLKNHCRFVFKDPATCQYTGTATSCARTLSACRALGNVIRFGGFPGVGNLGYQV